MWHLFKKRNRTSSSSALFRGLRCELPILPTDGHSAHRGPGLSRRHSATPTLSFLGPSLVGSCVLMSAIARGLGHVLAENAKISARTRRREPEARGGGFTPPADERPLLPNPAATFVNAGRQSFNKPTHHLQVHQQSRKIQNEGNSQCSK